MRVVITGANRGIGLELARQSAERGDTVIATARHPADAAGLKQLAEQYRDRLTVATCDVAELTSVRAFAKTVPGGVDALLNNAGVMGEPAAFEGLDFEDAAYVFSVNALGPLRLTQALLPQLRAGKGKKVLHVTSGMGSIADNRSGGYYGYRMSKAALNMASRSLAVDLRNEGISSAVISPGWVRTDMGGKEAPTSVEDSARGILKQLDALGPKTSGHFLDFSGKDWAW